MIKGSNRLDTVKEYYFSKKLREVASLIKSGKPIINMGIGSPDLFPSKTVININGSINQEPNRPTKSTNCRNFSLSWRIIGNSCSVRYCNSIFSFEVLLLFIVYDSCNEHLACHFFDSNISFIDSSH